MARTREQLQTRTEQTRETAREIERDRDRAANEGMSDKSHTPSSGRPKNGRLP